MAENGQLRPSAGASGSAPSEQQGPNHECPAAANGAEGAPATAAAMTQQQQQGPSSAPPDTRSVGPEAWAAQRRAWANPRKRRGAEQDGDAEERSRQPVIPPDAEYDTLLGAPYRRFEQPIPLPEMIEFLTDCWALSIGLD